MGKKSDQEPSQAAEPPHVRRRADRRQRIVDAAISLIAERGLNAFTLADVGNKLDYSRGVTGHYFATKEQLLDAALEQLLGKPLPEGKVGLKPLMELIDSALDRSSVGKEETRARFVLMGEAQEHSAVRERLVPFLRTRMDRVTAHLNAMKLAGELHPDVDPQAQAVLVYAAAVGAVLLSYSGVIDGEFDTLSRELKATLERGVVMKQPPSAQ